MGQPVSASYTTSELCLQSYIYYEGQTVSFPVCFPTAVRLRNFVCPEEAGLNTSQLFKDFIHPQYS